MFKFIGSIFHEMRLTTWPNRKQGWHDFIMVVEYTIFFMAFIMLFDWGLQNGFTRALNLLLPLVKHYHL
jgi:preprotein translocase subunit SecE